MLFRGVREKSSKPKIGFFSSCVVYCYSRSCIFGQGEVFLGMVSHRGPSVAVYIISLNIGVFVV